MDEQDTQATGGHPAAGGPSGEGAPTLPHAAHDASPSEETHLLTDAPPPPVNMAPPPPVNAAPPAPAPQAWSAAPSQPEVQPISWVPMALLSLASTVLGAVLGLLVLAKLNGGVLEFQPKPGAKNAADVAAIAASAGESGGEVPAASAPPAATVMTSATTAVLNVWGDVNAAATPTALASGIGMGSGVDLSGGLGMTSTTAITAANEQIAVSQGLAGANSTAGTMMASSTPYAAPASLPTATLVIAPGGAAGGAAALLSTPTLTPTATLSPATAAAKEMPPTTARAPRSSRPTPTLIIAAP